MEQLKIDRCERVDNVRPAESRVGTDGAGPRCARQKWLSGRKGSNSGAAISLRRERPMCMRHMGGGE